MDMSDVYADFPELMTLEEEEEWNHASGDSVIDDLPDWWCSKVLSGHMDASPEACSRQNFEERPPALGLSLAEIDALETHYQEPDLQPVQRRKMFSSIRCSMLRQLISTNGASSVSEMCQILREELEIGKPAAIPEWYVYSTTTMGRRKIGYDYCENRGCFATETCEVKFMKCSRCKLPFYCSKDCQLADWKGRHKKICKVAVERRKQTADVSKMMQFISDASLSEDGGGNALRRLQQFRTGMGGDDWDDGTVERVAKRRAELKKEKRRSNRIGSNKKS